MKFTVILCLAPALMGAIYYQGDAPAALSISPAEVPVSATLPVTPSPSMEPISATVAVTPSVPTVVDPVTCVQALATFQDMTALGYQRTTDKAYMRLLIAVGLAKETVLNKGLPDVPSIARHVDGLPWNGLLIDELKRMGTLVAGVCAVVK